jgi:hypothetical protein
VEKKAKHCICFIQGIVESAPVHDIKNCDFQYTILTLTALIIFRINCCYGNPLVVKPLYEVPDVVVQSNFILGTEMLDLWFEHEDEE